jgi:hypothetical protein
MARVRRGLVLVLLIVVVAGCGGSRDVSPQLADARARTVAAGSARFTLSINASVAGTHVLTSETGTVSFTQPRAHLYRLGSNIVVPQELILVGPYTYTNANVDAAMRDSSVKPWTKLDTRRLSATQRRARADELAHVRAMAYLGDGVASAKRVGVETVDDARATHFRGEVDPKRLAARAPARIGAAVRNDYAERPFPADVWLDDQGRVRHIRVAYRTARGGRVVIDGGFSDFGVKVDVSPPPADAVQDISP